MDWPRSRRSLCNLRVSRARPERGIIRGQTVKGGVIRHTKIRVVQQIEHLRTKFEFAGLPQEGQCRVFVDGQVPVPQMGPPQIVATLVAKIAEVACRVEMSGIPVPCTGGGGW